MSLSAMQFLVWAHRRQLTSREARVRWLREVAFPVIAGAEGETLRLALVDEVVETMNAL